MLYSEKELEKCLKAGCALYYFYASDEALVHTAAQKTLKYLNRDDPETTVLDGPTPSVEEIVLAAGTISFFGGRRLVLMPLIRPSTYSDKDLQDLCDTLADTENAIFVMTSVIEEKFGKLRPGKREQKLITACEKLGYCVQLNKPGRAALQEMARTWAGEYHTTFAPGAEAALLDRCGDVPVYTADRACLAALTGYTLTRFRLRGVITFVIDDLDEYTFLYTADGFEGQPIPCTEGDLQWIEKEKIGSLPLWEGDKLFFRLLEERQDVFSLKLTYIHDALTAAAVDGREISLEK